MDAAEIVKSVSLVPGTLLSKLTCISVEIRTPKHLTPFQKGVLSPNSQSFLGLGWGSAPHGQMAMRSVVSGAPPADPNAGKALSHSTPSRPPPLPIPWSSHRLGAEQLVMRTGLPCRMLLGKASMLLGVKGGLPSDYRPHDPSLAKGCEPGPGIILRYKDFIYTNKASSALITMTFHFLHTLKRDCNDLWKARLC